MRYSTVVVSMFAANDRAIRFYHKAGFTKCQDGQTEIGGTVVPTLQLIKTLS
jgi:RimJ/RimL family protein N-acetyltransferase